MFRDFDETSSDEQISPSSARSRLRCKSSELGERPEMLESKWHFRNVRNLGIPVFLLIILASGDAARGGGN